MPAMTTPSANHLPLEINASSMVIRSQRSKLRHTVDWILTVLAWIIFLYLFAKGIWAVGTNHVQGLDVPFFSRMLPSLDTLGIYALAMAFQGIVLIVWALYNWGRFHGKTRRGSSKTLQDEELTRSYGIDHSTLNSLRTSPVSVIHHSTDGTITAITHPARAGSLLQAASRVGQR